MMNEISFYIEFAEKFKSILKSYLDESYCIYYSTNNSLNSIIKELQHLSKYQLVPDNIYIPKLKVDIVFAIIRNDGKGKLLLIEAKYLKQLSLKDYSQLVGYLQVAKIINLGLLLLIQKEHSTNKISNDLQEILRLGKLPMDWNLDLQGTNVRHPFKTGIISYLPNNGMDWINTTEVNGISSFLELRTIMEH